MGVGDKAKLLHIVGRDTVLFLNAAVDFLSSDLVSRVLAASEGRPTVYKYLSSASAVCRLPFDQRSGGQDAYSLNAPATRRGDEDLAVPNGQSPPLGECPDHGELGLPQ